MASIIFSVDKFWFSFHARVVDADAIIIFSIDNTDCLGTCLTSLVDILVNPQSGFKISGTRLRGRSFIQ